MKTNIETNISSTISATKKLLLSATVCGLITSLSACAGNAARQTSSPYVDSYSDRTSSPNADRGQRRSSQIGVIESIRVLQTEGSSSGGGALLGGVVGGLAGSAFGGGSGKVLTTVAGAVGGAVVGNNIEKDRAQTVTSYELRLRMDNGDRVTVQQDNVNNLHEGSRIHLVDGRAYLY
ncbi:MAG: glycine zipper 2TM domain-containing protein [Burkholderiaceae bacterium]|nr:glycine zipper 2TM domain-containing protein [Burkholderiaceae bacterium]